MRFRLRTLLIVLAIGPPVLAFWWQCYGSQIPAWLMVVWLLLAFIPSLLAFAFGSLCRLIARLPGGNDRKDTGL